MLVPDFLSESALRRPDAAFVIQNGRRASYGEVETASARMARLLRDQGVRRGDRVGLLAPNSPRYVTAYYAAQKAGAIAVPLHASSDVRTLRRLLGDCGGAALVCGPGMAGRVSEAAAELPELQFVILPDEEIGAGTEGREDSPGRSGRGRQGDALDAPAFPAHVRTIPESAALTFRGESGGLPRGIDLDRACIIYTSGSTGRPRGVVLTHLNVVQNTRSILAYLHLTSEDRVLCLLPFPYVYGQSLLNTHAAVGGSLVLHDSLVFPDAALDVMEHEAVTGLSGVPSTFAILIHRSRLAERRIPSLRYVTQAGGGMPVAHVRKLIAALPGVRIYIMYGATEAAARLSWLPPEDLERKLGSAGRAIPNVELSVRREDGTEADTGEVGEIVARGSNIMEGYWNDAAATAEVLDQHGFHTGDLGRRDEEGFFWIVGRKREMIKSGAHRISPREIEEILLAHPDVEEAAVVGVPDEYLGEAIWAHLVVRPRSELPPEALIRFCQERLPAHKVPQKILIRDSLPRNAAGKIDKRALRGDAAD